MKTTVQCIVTSFLLGLTFLCNAQIIQTISETVYVDSDECKKTSSFYYDENDQKVLHGPCIIKADNKDNSNPNFKRIFFYEEKINYKHGKEDGAYSKIRKLDNQYKYRSMANTKESASVQIQTKISGFYKEGEKDGTWNYYQKANQESIYDNFDYTEVYQNGTLIEYTNRTTGENYTYKYVTDKETGKTIRLKSGTVDEYIVKNGFVQSHFIRLNGDVSPVENDVTNVIKQYLDDADNPVEIIPALVENGFTLVKPKNDDEIYILKRIKISSYDECMELLNDYYSTQENFSIMANTFLKYHQLNTYQKSVYAKQAVVDSLTPYINDQLELIDSIRNEVNGLKTTQTRIFQTMYDEIEYDQINRNYKGKVKEDYRWKADVFTFTHKYLKPELFEGYPPEKYGVLNRINENKEIYSLFENYILNSTKYDSIRIMNLIICSKGQAYPDVLKEYGRHSEASEISRNAVFIRNESDLRNFAKQVDEEFLRQKDCLSFLYTRIKIDENSTLIHAFEDAKYIQDIYSCYIGGISLSWNQEENGTRLEYVRTAQEKLLSILKEKNTKKLNKQAKREKATDLETIFSIAETIQ